MKIAILSWGSLINTGVDRGLEIDGQWHIGGPSLPLEFSRVSRSGDRAGCLTLVLDEQNGTNLPVRYALSSNTNLDRAITNLKEVENIQLGYTVGYVNLVRNTERSWSRQRHPISCNTIKAWAHQNEFDAVIWTALLPNFENILEIPFTVESAVNYVRNLPEETKIKARDYIINSPVEIVTPIKTFISHEIPPVNVELRRVGEGALARFVDRIRINRNR